MADALRRGEVWGNKYSDSLDASSSNSLLQTKSYMVAVGLNIILRR